MATTSLSDVAIFTIDDTSPTVVYAPFGDTLNLPNLLAGWNPYYDGSGFASGILGVDGEVGVGTSLHVTSRDGASLAVRWHGAPNCLHCLTYPMPSLRCLYRERDPAFREGNTRKGGHSI